MPLEARPLFTLDVTVSTRPLAVSSAVSSSTLRVSSALTLNSSALRRSRTGSPVGAGGTAASGLPSGTNSDRKRVVSGKSVSVRVALGGRSFLQKKKQKRTRQQR